MDVLSDAKILSEITTGSPPTGTPNRGGGRFKSAIFDQYFAISQKRCKIGTRGRLIGTCMRSIEWRYFQ